MEDWKEIAGYDGKYLINKKGEVMSLQYKGTHHPRILHSHIDQYGYVRVTLCKKGKHKRYGVHRLVALAFLPNPLNLPQINHIDEDKTNNNLDNLEWCNSSYNINYGQRNQLISEKRAYKVYQYNLRCELVSVYPSLKDAAKATESNVKIIWACCKKKIMSHNGFIWRKEGDIPVLEKDVYVSKERLFTDDEVAYIRKNNLTTSQIAKHFGKIISRSALWSLKKGITYKVILK